MFKIPNLITLINLLSGCLAIVFLFRHDLMAVIYCIVISLIADFLDGFVARLLNSFSDMGKELDSLADMVSFGFLPGAILFYLIQQGDLTTLEYQGIAGFIVTLFAALRLAKFNIDTRQSESFLGLPTPSATLFIAGLVLIYRADPSLVVFQWPVLLGIGILLSLLMISDIPMFSLKFKGFSWKGNEIRYIFIIFAAAMIPLTGVYSLSLIIAIYIIYSIAIQQINRSTNKRINK